MNDVPIPPERVQDPLGEERARPGPGPRPGAHADAVGRRPERGLHASRHDPPWLPLGPDCIPGGNVAAEHADPASMLALYRPLLALRRAMPR